MTVSEGSQGKGYGGGQDRAVASNSQEHNLTVAVRIRPMNEDEIIAGARPVAHAVEGEMVVLLDPTEDPDDVLRANRSREKQFVFDVTFDGSATQKEVYDDTTKALIPRVLDGYNATVFAYGATGAGKTYTMLGTDEEPGIMARALNDLFQEMSRTSEDMSYKVTLSYLEIYNEMIRDLLNPASGFLELREDSRGVQVAGLTEVTATSTKEVMQILMQGNKERTQEPTAANIASSRSHAVLQISILRRSRVKAAESKAGRQVTQAGRLFMIDLAGSERAANTQNMGKRMQEGAHINRSLLALGNCINALCDKNHARYVNYRDSKLTRLLKEALGGNCKTVMIAHVSPASLHFEESRNTLVYADRAKHIKTKIHRNVMDVSYHIAQYSTIIAELREEVTHLREKLSKQQQGVTSSREPDRHGDAQSQEVSKIKQRLLSNFNDQMELRRNIMDLNTLLMELSLESTQNRLVVRKWEREKAVIGRSVEPSIRGNDDFDSVSNDSGSDGNAVFLTEDKDKQRDLAGEGLPEPGEVLAARQQQQQLKAEQDRLEEQRETLVKELSATRQKGSNLEKSLPQHVSRSEHLEILQLMCQVHELEVENMEAQAAWLNQTFRLKEKDIVLDTYERHRELCEELIHQQQGALRAAGLNLPRETEELYQVYLQASEDMVTEKEHFLPQLNLPKGGTNLTANPRYLESESVLSFTDSHALGSLADVRLPAISLPPSSVQSSTNLATTKKNVLRRLATQTEEKPLFAYSPRAQRIKELQAQELARGSRSLGHLNESNKLVAPEGRMSHQPMPRQKSIITLVESHSGGASSPVLLEDEKQAGGVLDDIEIPPFEEFGLTQGQLPPQERAMMLNSTRNIVALAAARRKSTHVPAVGGVLRGRTFVADEDSRSNGPSQWERRAEEGSNRYNHSQQAISVRPGGQGLQRGRLMPLKNKNRSEAVSYQNLGKRHPRQVAQGQKESSSPARKSFIPHPQKAWAHPPKTTVEVGLPENTVRVAPVKERFVKKDKTKSKENKNLKAKHSVDDFLTAQKFTVKNEGNKNKRSVKEVSSNPTIPSYVKKDFGITGQGIQ